MIRRFLAASAIVALAASPASAQGKSKAHKPNTPAPPSRNDLAAPPVATISSGGATPMAWVDDASVLESGGVAVAVSVLRWSGSGLSEVNFPVVDLAVGLTRRVQFSASVPHIVGSADPTGSVGGLGTSFFSTKIGVIDNKKYNAKLAVSPTLELLSPGAAEWLPPGEHRVQLGLPVSAEIARGPVRVYGATGYFTRGAWFTGGGVGVVLHDKIGVSGAFSRAWRRSSVPDVPLSERDRNEISGGASYALTPFVHVFGSVGRTVATLVDNGAGATVGGGVSYFFAGR
jgi:hypothetical protein